MRIAGQVMGVYRQCQCCRTFKLTNRFRPKEHRCKNCQSHPRGMCGFTGMVLARAVVITDQGRAALREIDTA